MVVDIKRYVFDKLIFPKTFIVDKPGIIMNKTASKFNKEEILTRVIYTFEDLYSNLYLETVKKLGKEKTNLLWYKIGKDISTRYMLFMSANKIPKSLLPNVIEHIFDTFNSAGFSFAEKIKFEPDKKEFSSLGKNCIICRKT
jgi:hypothetical protein